LVQSLLNEPFASLFNDVGWTANGSRADDEPLRSMNTAGKTVAVPASASEPALRKLVMAYMMLADLWPTA
jgi:hypothetical protein